MAVDGEEMEAGVGFGNKVQWPKEGIDVDELAPKWAKGDGDGWGRTIVG